MTKYNRQQRILDLVRDNPSIRVSDIADKLGVSTGTVRNDLNSLEKKGRLERVHGGAVVRNQNQFQSNSFMRRYEQNITAKKAIALKVSTLINNGDSILLDASSTDYYLARELASKNNLRIITNGFEVARELAHNSSNTVILIGGVVNNNASAVSGLLSEKIIEDLHIQKAFLSCSGFTIERGMTEISLDEAQLKRKVIESAEQIYALIDSTKIGQDDMTSFIRVEKITTLFTDAGISKEWREKISNARIDLITCE